MVRILLPQWLNPANYHLSWPPYQPSKLEDKVVNQDGKSAGAIAGSSTEKKKNKSKTGKDESKVKESTPKQTAFMEVARNCQESSPDFFLYVDRVVTKQPPVVRVYFITGKYHGTNRDFSEEDLIFFTESGRNWEADPNVMVDSKYSEFKKNPKRVRGGYSGLLEVIDKAQAKKRNS